MSRMLLAHPARAIMLGFALVIAIGTLMLRLPASGADHALGWGDAFFVATSASTVTGLSTIDVRSALSPFGQVVLLALIQLGGIGVMGAAFGALVAVGRRVSMAGMLAARDELGSVATPRGMAHTLRNLVLLTFGIEAVAASVLFVHLLTSGERAGTAAFSAVFNAVNAFCNSGFDIYPNGAPAYVDDPVVNVVLAVTIVLGGLGFPVLVELWRLLRSPGGRGLRRARTSITAKLVIVGSAALTLVGVVGTLLLEWTNDATLGALDPLDRVHAALLLGVTSRTAGFQTIPFDQMRDPTLLVHEFLMFVGTGPISTGGGIRVTTLLVVLLVVLAQLRGERQPRAFGRMIPMEAVGRALTIIALSLAAVMAGTFTLVAAEDLELQQALFEATSAFGTVGLSLGVTADLDPVGRGVIAVLMFVGRIGPITAAAALAQRQTRSRLTYPEEEVALG